MEFIASLLGLAGEHWMVAVLVLSPVIVVAMALAALKCEVCGAPFGIFRRRNRTVDLCIRCAVLHDIRRAREVRDAAKAAHPEPERAKRTELGQRTVVAGGPARR